ncbi:tRNA pseudouridine13 synthase [Giardia muris]|uniref:tRNA pseudouridine13 synthase n=1 Tax=Giardia muris TaxID=5742 RepID=A0A4Z1SQ19_GIAMU|nr:tRNA pseudouridine13 synthase [Giardia muris]|eukprot:TNJ27932.1 tRNA pseudouridine13 synthase [Giardia muris]
MALWRPVAAVPCIFKQYYHDFAVWELDAAGKPVGLHSTQPAAEPELSSLLTDNKDEPPLKRSLNFDGPLNYLSADARTALQDFIQALDWSEPVEFPAPQTKEERTAVHHELRNLGIPTLHSQTLNPKTIQVFYGKRHVPRPPKRYLHFTLLKVGFDTIRAVGLLASRLPTWNRASREDFGFSGTKDKRGVTAQRVSVKGVWQNALVEAIKPWVSKTETLIVGDFEYSDEPLRLGSNQGNQFEVILRNIDWKHAELLLKNAKEMLREPFLNYFGTQRFGTTTVNTADVGAAILSGKNLKALLLIACGECETNGLREHETYRLLASLLEQVSSGAETITSEDDARIRSAFTALQSQDSKPRILLGLLRGIGKDPLSTIQRVVPHTVRSMYVHAFQSHLFNVALETVSAGLREDITTGRRTLECRHLRPGDMVLAGAGRYAFVSEDDILAGRYGLNDLALPLLGTAHRTLLTTPPIQGGTWDYAQKAYLRVLGAHGLSPARYMLFSNQRSMHEFTPPGDIRLVFAWMRNLQGTWIVHEHLNDHLRAICPPPTPLSPLPFVPIEDLEAPISSSLDTDAPPSKVLSFALSFSLVGSAYATEALRAIVGISLDPTEQKNMMETFKGELPT